MNVGGDHDGRPHGVRQELQARGLNRSSALDGAKKDRAVCLPPRTDVPRQIGAVAPSSGSAEIDFREFVVSRGRSLLHAAYLMTGNLADAEDLVQSALAKTYQAWDRIADRKALDGYVRRAMVNTHISWWRRRKLDEYPTDEVPDQPVADATVSSEQHDALRRAIDRLPERMRTAVILRFFEDMTEAEIANVLGVSQGTVKSTVSRAVAKLRSDADLLPELSGWNCLVAGRYPVTTEG